MGLLIHGDAAFSGLGIVPETLQLADLEGYRTGGVIHVVINNQVPKNRRTNNALSLKFCKPRSLSGNSVLGIEFGEHLLAS